MEFGAKSYETLHRNIDSLTNKMQDMTRSEEYRSASFQFLVEALLELRTRQASATRVRDERVSGFTYGDLWIAVAETLNKSPDFRPDRDPRLYRNTTELLRQGR